MIVTAGLDWRVLGILDFRYQLGERVVGISAQCADNKHSAFPCFARQGALQHSQAPAGRCLRKFIEHSKHDIQPIVGCLATR